MKTENDLEPVPWSYQGQKVYVLRMRTLGPCWVPAVVDRAFGDAAYVSVADESESNLTRLDDLRKLKSASK